MVINSEDNVAVAARDIDAGEEIALSGRDPLKVKEAIPAGHKVALGRIEPSGVVIKYSLPIGTAEKVIERGEWVHTHNVRTGLGEILSYTYSPLPDQPGGESSGRTFMGYRREDGSVGIRNEIWIIPTVNCVNRQAELIACKAREKFSGTPGIEGIYDFKHPYGCSQIGEDHRMTQKILANLAAHPNAGGVLLLGLGCENNQADELVKLMGGRSAGRVKILVAQEVEDEISGGLDLVEELIGPASACRREPCSISELKVGLECGGSDAFSGITANPLVGEMSDMVVGSGGTALLTEVPEMFGAETILMNRAENEAVFEKTVSLINDYKQYFIDHNQPVYENPSVGNKRGGISTLEEKSLGCIQKGGGTRVTDVLKIGELVTRPGLNLISGPGNDSVSCTIMAAAGCQVIVFTTGRGTPFGSCVPTIKIATNSKLYNSKKNWIDFNAGQLLEGRNMHDAAKELFGELLEVAGGKHTKSEQMGFREIALMKSGVIC